jgi:ribosome recycling factor
VAFDLNEMRRRMDGALEALKKELGGLRTGRASANLLDPVAVEVYGSAMPLAQLATISVPEPRMLSVTVWDKANTKAVEKAIRDAGLGLNPMGEGTVVRVPIPDLTEERRKELTKVASKYAEEARVHVRNVRRDGMDGLKKQEKDGDISQDEHRTLSEKVQKMTDEFVKKIDEALSHKEKEILKV